MSTLAGWGRIRRRCCEAAQQAGPQGGASADTDGDASSLALEQDIKPAVLVASADTDGDALSLALEQDIKPAVSVAADASSSSAGETIEVNPRRGRTLLGLTLNPRGWRRCACLGRRKYKLLESYNAWLRGGVLDPGQYGPGPGEEGCDVIDVVEDDDPDGEAARVTALLGVMLPHYFDFQSVPDDLVDARIPLEGQQERFARLGWDTIPSTGRLMQRMVEYVEDRVAIHIIAGELNSAGRPCRHDERLLTEDAADAADTYDSDSYGGAPGGLGLTLTSFEHRGPPCLLTLTRSTSPPLDQFPLRVCSYPLFVL